MKSSPTSSEAFGWIRADDVPRTTCCCFHQIQTSRSSSPDPGVGPDKLLLLPNPLLLLSQKKKFDKTHRQRHLLRVLYSLVNRNCVLVGSLVLHQQLFISMVVFLLWHLLVDLSLNYPKDVVQHCAGSIRWSVLSIFEAFPAKWWLASLIVTTLRTPGKRPYSKNKSHTGNGLQTFLWIGWMK